IREENKSPIDHLFELAIDRIEARNGEVTWSQQASGLYVTGKNMSGTMLYSTTDKTYDGKLNLDLLSTREQKSLPFPGKSSLHFLLHPDHTEIQAFQFNTDRSHLEGNGTITNFGNPEVTFRYTAAVDLQEFGQAAKTPALRAGRLTVNGTAIYRNQSYSSQGMLSVQDASWNGSSFHLAGVELASPFS